MSEKHGIDWSQFFRGVGKRLDLGDTWYPDLVDSHEPALLNQMPALAAAAVAARLLKVLADRGATRVKPSSVASLLEVLEHALPEDVRHHADDEVTRIIAWLRFPPEPRDPEDEDPQMRIMHEGDVETRIATAEYALENDFDLELEYWSPDRKIWPHRRARPVRIERGETVDDAFLVIEHEYGNSEIAFVDVRWLMPVERRKIHRSDEAKVLTFPGADEH